MKINTDLSTTFKQGTVKMGQSSNSEESESSSKKIVNSFGQILKEKLSEVNQLKLHSDEMTHKLVTGDVKDIHEVMIAAEKARIALEYTMALRNEAIKAYQEIMRMR